MAKYALYVPLEAKPGKEKDVSDFLRSALPLVNAEPGTISWFAIQSLRFKMCQMTTGGQWIRMPRVPWWDRNPSYK